MSDVWLKEMVALSIVMDDFGEPKMAGRLRVWIERGKALRNEVTELRMEDIRKAYAIVRLQDALTASNEGENDIEESSGVSPDIIKEAEDEVKYKFSEEDEDDLLEKYFKDRL